MPTAEEMASVLGRQDPAFQQSVDRWKHLGKDVFFGPANALKNFNEQPSFMNFLGIVPMGGIGKAPINPWKSSPEYLQRQGEMIRALQKKGTHAAENQYLHNQGIIEAMEDGRLGPWGPRPFQRFPGPTE